MKKSFKEWCYENLSNEKANEILDRWDYKKNIKNGVIINPSSISFSSHGFNDKGYWFKCPNNNHQSELKNIHNFIRNKKEGVLQCNACNSFAQWGTDNLGKDFLDKYWDYEKNKNVSPWEIFKSCNKKVWIKCQEKDYHESYYSRVSDFTYKNSRCPYCASNSSKVHTLDSLGNFLKKNNLFYLWSNKNNKNPYEVAIKSEKKFWWRCPNEKHEDFYRSSAISMMCDFRCPECNNSKGEVKISEYLINNKIDYIPQKTYNGLLGLNNGKLSYDFYLPKYNLLIEYQGQFHDGNGNDYMRKNLKRQQEHDKRKKQYAVDNNIKLLEIWYYDYDNIEDILNKEIINTK